MEQSTKARPDISRSVIFTSDIQPLGNAPGVLFDVTGLSHDVDTLVRARSSLRATVHVGVYSSYDCYDTLASVYGSTRCYWNM